MKDRYYSLTNQITVFVTSRIYLNYIFVGSCLATKVFIGNYNLPAMGRGWVIIK